MKEIALTQGKIALVDDEDYEWLNQFKWYVHKTKHTFYARRMSPWINKERHMIQMHYEIIGKPPEGLETDHINGCGADNRRENLRFVTHRQNMQNRKNGKKTSKYPGLFWDKRDRKWVASIIANGKYKNLGYFTDEREAFEAYRKAVNALSETVIDEEKYLLKMSEPLIGVSNASRQP